MLLVPAMLPVMAVTPYRLYDNLFYFSVNHCYYQCCIPCLFSKQARQDRRTACNISYEGSLKV